MRCVILSFLELIEVVILLYDDFLQAYLIFIDPFPWHGKVKVINGSEKSDSMVGSGVF